MNMQGGNNISGYTGTNNAGGSNWSFFQAKPTVVPSSAPKRGKQEIEIKDHQW
jgi:hypothetical protein